MGEVLCVAGEQHGGGAGRRPPGPYRGADYFGAGLTSCVARLPARELRGEGALAAAAAQGEIQKMVEAPLDCWPGWEFFKEAGDGLIVAERMMNMSGSPGFGAYDVDDFGWGRPSQREHRRQIEEEGYI